MSDDVTAVVLVGGRSTRMGRDKALLVPDPTDGRTLTQLVLAALAAVASRSLLAGRSLPGLDVPAVPDQYSGAGPLAGIAAALGAVDTPLAMVSACDMPAIRPTLLHLLLDAARAHPEAPVVLCRSDAGLEPLLSAWRPALALPDLRSALDAGVRSLREAIALLPRHLVLDPGSWRPADPEGVSFHNWNTPEDVP
ncbi:MAG TPA: NTP transferase domain-containing protein [Candidatus Dormibacteraeota bacterium]|nr:NTP transferase domain-containing protein [Candidatus Dormibacteraeota bacterium]